MHDNKILLTVIVPIRNMESRLGLLKEWLSRTPKFPIEVRLVIDKSEDETQSEVIRIVENISNANIHVISGVFGSPGSARNAALNGLRSEWLAFWDSDDYPCLENVFKLLSTANSAVDVYIGNFTSTEFSTVPTSTHFEHMMIEKPRVASIINSPGIWRWIMKTELVEGLDFPPLPLGEDQSFLAMVIVRQPVILRTGLQLYTYSTGRKGSQTASRANLKYIEPTIQNIRSCRSESNSFKTNLLLTLVILRLKLSKLRIVL